MMHSLSLCRQLRQVRVEPLEQACDYSITSSGCSQVDSLTAKVVIPVQGNLIPKRLSQIDFHVL